MRDTREALPGEEEIMPVVPTAYVDFSATFT
jgi:hypothetical protein